MMINPHLASHPSVVNGDRAFIRRYDSRYLKRARYNDKYGSLSMRSLRRRYRVALPPESPTSLREFIRSVVGPHHVAKASPKVQALLKMKPRKR
jgi:hypothetical protein